MGTRTAASFEQKQPSYIKTTDHLDGFEARAPTPVTVEAGGMVFRCVCSRSYWGGIRLDLAQLAGPFNDTLERPAWDTQGRCQVIWQQICEAIRVALAAATGRKVGPVHVDLLDLDWPG